MARATPCQGGGQQRKRRPHRASRAQLEQLNLKAAGIDVGAESHWVAVPPDRDEQPVQEFGAFTADFYALAEWLRQCQIDTVVMESTGVYGIPLFEVLEERGFDVKLVDPHSVRRGCITSVDSLSALSPTLVVMCRAINTYDTPSARPRVDVPA